MIDVMGNQRGAYAFLRAISRRMNNALSEGVRDSLAEVQRIHKTQVIKRGGGAVVPDTFTVRTGELSRSYTIDHRKGSLKGSYGSYLKRAVAMEKGARITPKKAKFLTIPTKAVKRMRRARDYPDLFFMVSKKGTSLLARRRAGGIQPMFILKRSVTLPPRPTLETAVTKAEPAIDNIMGIAVGRNIDVSD